MYYQVYFIYLIDGTSIEVVEPYDLPMEDSLFRRYEKAKVRGSITAFLRDGTSVCVLKSRINYIRMSHVIRVYG